MLEVLLKLLFFLGVLNNASSTLSYIGAVVEYRPVTDGKDGRKVAQQNAANFKTIIKKASDYNADIIVFPEIGLTSLPENRSWTIEKIRSHHYYAASYIPGPQENIVLCNSSGDYAESLKSISCAAKEFAMYVVVNHHERADCLKSEDCSPDGFLLYNTNVVFDRKGQIAARYRKFNLFSEPGINVTSRPEVSTFETDFGVKFGQFICNDILYTQPAIQLVRELGITDVVFSAEWFSELLFLTSVQTHAAWAYENDVNLLSSGFNEPAFTNGGSGIYLGKQGVLKATAPNESANVLLVSEIPKVINGQRQIKNPMILKEYKFSETEIPTTWYKGQNFMYKDNFSLYTTEILETKYGQYSKKLCNRGLCCTFKLNMDFNQNLALKNNSKQNYYRYRIGVFNGTRLFAGSFTVGIEVCGLFFCRNNTLASCGELFHENSDVTELTNFSLVVIERKVNNDAKKFYLPMTLKRNFMPVESSSISYNVLLNKNKEKILQMKLMGNEQSLMAAAIYGRNLRNDGV